MFITGKLFLRFHILASCVPGLAGILANTGFPGEPAGSGEPGGPGEPSGLREAGFQESQVGQESQGFSGEPGEPGEPCGPGEPAM